MADAIGYAVKSATGEIDVRTVCPTLISTMINGLVPVGVIITAGTPDDAISEAWREYAELTGASIIMVEIKERAHADA